MISVDLINTWLYRLYMGKVNITLIDDYVVMKTVLCLIFASCITI